MKKWKKLKKVVDIKKKEWYHNQRCSEQQRHNNDNLKTT